MPHKITEKCIGCSACAKLCPVFAITGEPKSMYHINEKRCVDCSVCGKVCPKSAIENRDGNTVEQVKRTEWKKPLIDEELCSACGICMLNCAPGALSVSMPKERGDIEAYALLSMPNKCIGCGICEKHCPLDAIQMVNSDRTVENA